MHLLLAWRNIWRNPKRTAVILAAVIVGAWTMVFLGALSRGVLESMLRNSLNTLTGHIQIQKPAYRDDPVVENRIDDPAPILAVLERNLPVGGASGAHVVQRMEVGGVAANARNTAAVSIVGVQPRLEPEVSFYGDHIVQGEELAPDDVYGIVVGKALLDSFETRLGRKIVLMTQGADKETASRAFRIRGVYRAELEATEKRYVFISLEAARELLGAPGAVTGICLKLPDRERAEGVAQRIRPDLPPDVGVYTWRQLLPLLLGYMDMFNSVMLLWYLVVFIAMAFGLVNTTLMAVLERTREFGLLKALGMKPIWIVRGVLTECLILLAVGLCLGNLCGVLTVVAFSGGINLAFLAEGSQYFGLGNIIVPLLAVRDMALANGVILGLGLVVCLYPAIKAGRITPVEAMHG